MTRPLTDREALIAALAEEARSGAGGEEPAPEELLDYLAGRLAPEDERRIDRQIVASPAAARALLDLADLEAAGAAAGARPSELAAQAGWRDLRGRLPAAGPWFRRQSPLLSSVAAALLVTTLGLGSWVWRLQGELRHPIANVRSLELPASTRAETERVIELPPEAPLLLVLEPAERCPVYTAALEGPQPGARQTIAGLERDEGGQLALQLQRAEPGHYRLRLFGCEPRHELTEHRFQISRPHGD